jgi:uncharacterized membrane protein YidH (DUF202 family)
MTDDPGLARERTQLAWNRTAASFAVVGLAVLRASPAAGAVTMAMGAAVWGIGRLGRGRALDQRRKLRLIAVATTGVCLLSLVIALFPA